MVVVQVRIFVHMCRVGFGVCGRCAKHVVVVGGMCMCIMVECAGMNMFKNFLALFAGVFVLVCVDWVVLCCAECIVIKS